MKTQPLPSRVNRQVALALQAYDDAHECADNGGSGSTIAVDLPAGSTNTSSPTVTVVISRLADSLRPCNPGDNDGTVLVVSTFPSAV